MEEDAGVEELAGVELVFIVNEKSGNGNGAKVWRKIESSMTLPYDIFKTTYEKQAIEYAEKVKALAKESEQPILLIGIGGDGTYHEILNGLVGPGIIKNVLSFMTYSSSS